MKYAILNGKKSEALKGAFAICPCCGSKMIAKCGDIKIHHWAHSVESNCDKWWENETPWHREWKNKFPVEWQEVVQFDETGEKHIADVKTSSNWVIEFQYSYLKSEERRSRNKFYNKLVWVVNGNRRKTDVLQFNNMMRASRLAPIGNVRIYQINRPFESRLLNEWSDSNTPVFFDFNQSNSSVIWFLLPLGIEGRAYLTAYSREEFVNLHNESSFDELHELVTQSIRKMLVNP